MGVGVVSDWGSGGVWKKMRATRKRAREGVKALNAPGKRCRRRRGAGRDARDGAARRRGDRAGGPARARLRSSLSRRVASRRGSRRRERGVRSRRRRLGFGRASATNARPVAPGGRDALAATSTRGTARQVSRARRRRSRASSPRVVDRVVASRRASGRLRGGISSPSALASRPAEPGETPDERRDRVRDDAATTPRGGRGIARVVGTYRRRCVSAKRALKRDVARARPSPYAVAAKKQTRVRRVGAGETQRATRQQSNPARLLRVKKKMNRRTIPSIATTRDAPDVHL